MAELHLMREDAIVHVRPLGTEPLHIGRAASNGMVLADTRISSRHAVIWVSEGRVRIEDLGSKNGTFVNDEPLQGVAVLRDGDRLRLGSAVLRVRCGEPDKALLEGPLLVEDPATGLQHPIRSDRFLIGAGPQVDLRCGTQDREATLLIHPNGEVWLGTLDREYPLEVDSPFEVAGRPLVLRVGQTGATRTDPRVAARYPYRIEVAADPAITAQLVDLTTGQRHLVTSEHRASLLFVLARQAQTDREEGRPLEQAGWCADQALSVGVWGRRHRDQLPNNLHVLLFRLRREVQEAGFDPWFIEKRRGHTRIRVAEVRAL